MIKKRFFSETQNAAANPVQNIWVQANAGTGKTTVLIRRLLRILFRNECYGSNTPPGILCLTYTNTAASEMRNRILAQLREWSIANDEDLTDLLDGIPEHLVITKEDLFYARKVFFMYIDNPDVLKIKTIHSFCEEILHRFPLEAGISPAWSLVSGAAQAVLLQDAFDKMIQQSFRQTDDTKRVIDAFYRIINIKSEHFLSTLRELLVMHYKSFFQVDNTETYRKYFIDKTKQILGLEKCPDMSVDNKTLQNIISYAKCCNKSKKKPVEYIQNIIINTEQYIDKTIDFLKYKNCYLTKDNTVLKNVLKHELFATEAARVYKIQQYLLNLETFENTLALFDLSMGFADTYRSIKQEHNYLDFEDLILYTQKLFQKPDVMGWVLSQLDVSLGHILVDEAQDTSPQQWNILRMLAGDFFTDGDNQNNRSIFVVGDTKQSIYGFQNADPVAFATSRDAIAEQIKQNYRTIQEVALEQSFRSVEPILKTVDYFFDNPSIISATGFHNNKHICYRRGEKGFVEMHNLFKTDVVGTDKSRLYANMIADKIEQLVKKENVAPKDILVLVQKRSSFVEPLSLALKKRGVDIVGNDRVKLPDFPAIKDMLHLVRFCINNANDYSLCCVLKSPIYRLKEADIFYLCKTKNDINTKETPITIFDVLHEKNPDIYNDLTDIINQSKTLAPYSFFTYVLNKNNNRERIIAALGKHVIDPVEEFLSMCLAYERTQPGTLYDFIKWFITGDSEIKRDMDASQGVRIMTVHGSKGLDSPIVFLIDTVYLPKSESMLNLNYLHNKTDYDLWLWKTTNSDIIQSIVDKNRQDDIAEYYRLLYVAMTRTKDKLYIYGCDMAQVPELSWHTQLWNVLSQIKNVKIDDTTIRITNDTQFE